LARTASWQIRTAVSTARSFSNHNRIQWEFKINPGLGKKDKALAEQAYLLALENPGYFMDLYYNTDGSLWQKVDG